MISLFVPGHPAPQGSKRYIGRGVTIESSKAVAPWRADIREHVLARRGEQPPLDGALSVRLTFVMPRPKSLPKSKATPPAVKTSDVDKLARAVLDALTSAGAWIDDKQVCELYACKRIAELGETPGCLIHVQPTVSPHTETAVDWKVIARKLGEQDANWGGLSTRETDALRTEIEGHDEMLWSIRRERAQ